MLRYVWRLTWISVVFGPIIVAQSTLGGGALAILSHAPGVQPAMKILLSAVISIIVIVALLASLVAFNRLSPLLPAAALGEKQRMREAWAMTRGQGPAFVTLSLILVAGNGALIAAGTELGLLHLTILAWAWLAVSYWLRTMVGVSVLTTIYGHYVEKRPLRA